MCYRIFRDVGDIGAVGGKMGAGAAITLPFVFLIGIGLAIRNAQEEFNRYE